MKILKRLIKSFKTVIRDAAKQSISRSKGRLKRKAVLWWTDKCGQVVKERNKALGILRRTHTVELMIIILRL